LFLGFHRREAQQVKATVEDDEVQPIFDAPAIAMDESLLYLLKFSNFNTLAADARLPHKVVVGHLCEVRSFRILMAYGVPQARPGPPGVLVEDSLHQVRLPVTNKFDNDGNVEAKANPIYGHVRICWALRLRELEVVLAIPLVEIFAVGEKGTKEAQEIVQTLNANVCERMSWRLGHRVAPVNPSRCTDEVILHGNDHRTALVEASDLRHDMPGEDVEDVRVPSINVGFGGVVREPLAILISPRTTAVYDSGIIRGRHNFFVLVPLFLTQEKKNYGDLYASDSLNYYFER